MMIKEGRLSTKPLYLTLNQWVEGSSPSGETEDQPLTNDVGGFFIFTPEIPQNLMKFCGLNFLHFTGSEFQFQICFLLKPHIKIIPLLVKITLTIYDLII